MHADAGGDQLAIAMMQDFVGSPRTAAAIRGKRRVKSPPFRPLCGAPHNAERF
jgi:hypothetical protein